MLRSQQQMIPIVIQNQYHYTYTLVGCLTTIFNRVPLRGSGTHGNIPTLAASYQECGETPCVPCMYKQFRSACCSALLHCTVYSTYIWHTIWCISRLIWLLHSEGGFPQPWRWDLMVNTTRLSLIKHEGVLSMHLLDEILVKTNQSSVILSLTLESR